MALKVVISLPNNVAITIEASDFPLYQEIINAVLKELPRELAQLPLNNPPNSGEAKKDNNPEAVQSSEEKSTTVGSGRKGLGHEERSDRAFIEFCEALSPIGDMRRVVVAAEGAHKFLGIQQVSPHELKELFELSAWPMPKDLLQSLRNAARSSFRWLERVPGNRGYYTVSDRGRQAVVETIE